MTSFYRRAFAKTETEASLWAKDRIPSVMLKKSPIGLSSEPKATKTKIPVFDGIMGPGVRRGVSNPRHPDTAASAGSAPRTARDTHRMLNRACRCLHGRRRLQLGMRSRP